MCLDTDIIKWLGYTFDFLSFTDGDNLVSKVHCVCNKI